MKQISVFLINDVAEIDVVSQTIGAFGRSQHLPEEVLYAVNLAIDEILTNVISYGYSDGAGHLIAVRVSVLEDALVAEVTDDARPFNPLDVPPTDTSSLLSAKQIGGLGIHLARKLMDGMEYRREQDKNVLIMKKRIASS
jgi:anti-sigma regulatory factor (Ser/Thr protein kinase)